MLCKTALAYHHILWIVNSNHHPEGRCGVRVGSKRAIANIWLLSWKLFSVTHLCVPGPAKSSRESDKSSFKVSLQTRPLLLMSWTCFFSHPETFCNFIANEYQGVKRGLINWILMIVVCLINLFEAHALRHFYYGNDGRELLSLCQQGLHPDPDTDETDVKRRFHTNIGIGLLTRWQNESNYGSFCQQANHLVNGTSSWRPRCLRPQGWLVSSEGNGWDATCYQLLLRREGVRRGGGGCGREWKKWSRPVWIFRSWSNPG